VCNSNRRNRYEFIQLIRGSNESASLCQICQKVSNLVKSYTRASILCEVFYWYVKYSYFSLDE